MRKSGLLLLLIILGIACLSCGMVGAYTESRTPTAEEIELFRSTYRQSPALTPVAVSTQVVAGTNYRYECVETNSCGAKKACHRSRNTYTVTIFVPLPCHTDARPQVTEVKRNNK